VVVGQKKKGDNSREGKKNVRGGRKLREQGKKRATTKKNYLKKEATKINNAWVIGEEKWEFKGLLSRKYGNSLVRAGEMGLVVDVSLGRVFFSILMG